MPEEFLNRIDQVADVENRSRSELIREALRTYIYKQKVRESTSAARNADILEQCWNDFRNRQKQFRGFTKPLRFEDYSNCPECQSIPVQNLNSQNGRKTVIRFGLKRTDYVRFLDAQNRFKLQKGILRPNRPQNDIIRITCHPEQRKGSP